MTIGITGLGLIGGSLAKSIKTRTPHTVYGFDINEETMLKARMSGAIDGKLHRENIPLCDIIIVALRPGASIEYVSGIAGLISKSAIVVDICGIKRHVCSALSGIAAENGFEYIGGHPMAGKENGGFDNSDASLFVNAPMILTPDKNTNMEMLVKLKSFFMEIGFKSLVFTTPADHDKTIAYTSQLAHITSSAFVKSPTAQYHNGFSAGSFRDMTRVAKLDEDMWTELFMDNADYLTGELETLINNLTPYLDALKNRDEDKMRRLLREGRELKAKTMT